MAAALIANAPVLVRRMREIAPRRVAGQSRPFAFNMDDLSLDELNEIINQAGDTIAALLAERGQ